MPQQVIRRDALGTLTKLGQGGQGIVYRAPNAKSNFAHTMAYKEYKPDARTAVSFKTLATMPKLVEDTLSDSDRMELVSLAAWPCSLVENPTGPVGFVMPTIPNTFYIDLTTVKGVSRTTAEFQHLLNPASVLTARNIAITDRQRYQLLREVAAALAFLHRIGVCVGDISPKNLLFSLTPLPAVYFIDCDAMRINGVSALPQVETPEWEVPAGQELATIQSDAYKLGLLALRLLTGDQHTKDIQQLPPKTPKLIRQLITDTLVNDPSRRPLAETWIYLLRDAIEDTKGSASTRPKPPSPPKQPTHAPEPQPVVRSRPTAAPAKRPLAARATTLATTASAPSPLAWYPTKITRTTIGVVAAGLLVVVTLIALITLANSSSNESTRDARWSPSSLTTTTPPASVQTTIRSTTASPTSSLSPAAQAVVRASVGSCIRRVQGAPNSDGTSYQATVSYAECGSPDATDRVESIQYTNGTPTCDYWVRTSEVAPPKVLCLSALSGSNRGADATAAGPPPTIPGPADAGYCGAHTSPWNCWSDVSPARPGEIAFINYRLQYEMAGIPTDRTRLLQIGRGVCQSLTGGTHPNYIVKWLAEDIGVTEDQAGQLFIMAKDRACS